MTVHHRAVLLKSFSMVFKMNNKKSISSISILIALVLLAGCSTKRQVEIVERETAFTLRTNYNEFTHEELNAHLFNEIIESFEPDVWDFMVLSPDKPIGNSTFLQVGAPEETVDYYTIEAGFYDEENGLVVYRLFTLDKDYILQRFIDYWQSQIIPDISSWEDITEELW